MATVMKMYWPEITKEQYDQARKEVNWEGQVPKGAKCHIAWFAGDGCHVIDVWDSQADFERFVADRLMPVVQRIGIKGQPKTEFWPAYATFAPNI